MHANIEILSNAWNFSILYKELTKAHSPLRSKIYYSEEVAELENHHINDLVQSVEVPHRKEKNDVVSNVRRSNRCRIEKTLYMQVLKGMT
jgi:hypothetical protein